MPGHYIDVKRTHRAWSWRCTCGATGTGDTKADAELEGDEHVELEHEAKEPPRAGMWPGRDDEGGPHGLV